MDIVTIPHSANLARRCQEEVRSTLPCNSSQAFASRRLNFVTAPSRPSNCSPFSPYRQCSSGVIFGSSTAGHSFLDIACRGKGGFVQQGSLASERPESQNPFIRSLSGPKLVGYGAHLAPRHHCKTPFSGPKLVVFSPFETSCNIILEKAPIPSIKSL